MHNHVIIYMKEVVYMTSVISFADYNNKNYSNSKELILFFDKYKNRIDNFINENNQINDDDFFNQYNSFNNIYNEVKDNKKWINDEKINKMFEMENTVLFDNKGLDEAFNNENEFNTYCSFLTFIMCIDKSKGKVLELDDNYVHTIVNSLLVFDDINPDKYKDILNVLMDNRIKDLICNNDDIRESDVDDIIEMIIEGRDISNIISIFEESNSYNVPSIDGKMLTIDRIHDYYINQLNIFFIDEVDDETYSTIDMITMLNHMDLNNKNMYVKLVYDVREKDLSMLEQLNFIKDLTEVFMYLFVDNDINISFDDVKNIVALKYLNNTSIEQTIEDLKLNINGGMKQ